MRIAVFGGSFDPVHAEHVRLVEAALKELSLDKVVVMPAGAPPHKAGKRLTAADDRMQMCRLAFRNFDCVEISDYEIKKGGTSYTYLTCRDFRTRYPDAEIFWLVGTDMLRDFPTWRNPEEILSCVTLAVCGRNEPAGWVEKEQEKFLRSFGKKFVYLRYNAAAVSSTKIRVLAGAGMRLNSLTSAYVEEYIVKRGLYAIPFAKEALALEKEERRAHSLRVAELAAARAVRLKIPEDKAIAAALFHDCAKNLPADSPYLAGFHLPDDWGEVPKAVAHQFAGAFVAEKYFGVQDEDVINAIRYHTSARENMSDLEKLIFLADMLEEARAYEGVEALRVLFWEGTLNECMEKALLETLRFLKEKGGDIYPLTKKAYEFYKKTNTEVIYERGNE